MYGRQEKVDKEMLIIGHCAHIGLVNTLYIIPADIHVLRRVGKIQAHILINNNCSKKLVHCIDEQIEPACQQTCKEKLTVLTELNGITSSSYIFLILQDYHELH